MTGNARFFLVFFSTLNKTTFCYLCGECGRLHCLKVMLETEEEGKGGARVWAQEKENLKGMGVRDLEDSRGRHSTSSWFTKRSDKFLEILKRSAFKIIYRTLRARACVRGTSNTNTLTAGHTLSKQLIRKKSVNI